MKTLTFDQVKRERRFAQHEDGGLEFWPVTKGIVVYGWMGNDMPTPDEVPTDGWLHLSDCNCKFCCDSGLEVRHDP